MIAALMVYGIIASLLLLSAGLALEVAFSGSSLPRRFIWCGAIVLSCGLALIASRNALGPESPTAAAEATPSLAIEASEAAYPASNGSTLRESLLQSVADGLRRPVAAAARAGLDTSMLLGSWAVASVVLMAIGIWTSTRTRRLRRTWDLVEMEGLRVRLSPATGPAVLGILRPEIVVPGWLHSSSAEERRLALLHESEHVRARDGLLLASAWVAVALLPWNLPLWWMVLRLRLAIEIDCDARVLAAGAERRSYGSMLIDVSGHASGFSLTAPALVGFPSPLEKRLVAMTMRKSGVRWVPMGFGTLLGGMAFLAACQADLPTAADIEALDAATVAERAQELGIESTSYYIDGQPATAEEAGGLAAGEIGRVEVTREEAAGGSGGGSIRIYTRDYGAPAFVIDGKEATQTDFNALPPEDIEHISILKDASAAVTGFRAPNGVVLVTTKAGSGVVTAPTAGEAGSRPSASGAVSAEPVVVEGRPSATMQRGGGNYVEFPAPAAPKSGEPVIGPAPEGGYNLSFGVSVDSATGERTISPIRLRNMGEPLYVIDGLVSSSDAFNRMNASDIEGISVLKGAGSSAYASDPRAANGVILVTTKAGRR